jgi:hypothetical protein
MTFIYTCLLNMHVFLCFCCCKRTIIPSPRNVSQRRSEQHEFSQLVPSFAIPAGMDKWPQQATVPTVL